MTKQSAVQQPAEADANPAFRRPSEAPVRSGQGTDDDGATAAGGRTDSRQEPQAGQGPPGNGGHSVAEWVTLAISSLIVVGLLALTTYFYLSGSGAPVIVEVEPRPAEAYQAGTRFYLPVTVHNRGGETGEEVRVRVTLTGPDGRQETSEYQIQFLAGGATSRAVVSFANDPRQGQIEAGVVSYLEP